MCCRGPPETCKSRPTAHVEHINYAATYFTGLRQSEEIGLRVAQCDLVKGTVNICETVVLGKDKDRTKTNEDRTVELCPRALAVLKRQFALRGAVRAGRKDQA
jgi:integrase